jgi:hypothetical protein
VNLGFSTRDRALIDIRDVGGCVACGGIGQEKHHRRRRRENGDGKAHTPANGILLCGWGNQTGCHGRVHSDPRWARPRGYVVRPGVDPATVPVWHHSRGWIMLDEDGGWKAADGGAAMERGGSRG